MLKYGAGERAGAFYNRDRDFLCVNCMYFFFIVLPKELDRTVRVCVTLKSLTNQAFFLSSSAETWQQTFAHTLTKLYCTARTRTHSRTHTILVAQARSKYSTAVTHEEKFLIINIQPIMNVLLAAVVLGA